MAHKSKDTRKLEEYCETAGLTKQYCKMIGEISLRYYRYAWLPSLRMEETADTLPLLRDAVFSICDRSSAYPKDRLVRSVMTISRLDRVDIIHQTGNITDLIPAHDGCDIADDCRTFDHAEFPFFQSRLDISA